MIRNAGSRRSIGLTLAALALSALLTPVPARAFDGARAKALDDTLASDRYRGRRSGLPGGAMTEDFVAANFREWGLEPGGGNGTFFQTFPLLATREVAAAMDFPDDPLGPTLMKYGDDFTLVTHCGSGDVTAGLVVAGHGLSDPARGWDDYGGLDVSGKIVLIVRGSPDNGYAWGDAGSRDSLLTEARRRGAVAVLFQQGSDDHAVNGAAIGAGVYHPDFPEAMVGPRFMRHVFLATGWDPGTYTKALEEHPVPFDTGKRLHFMAAVERIPGAHARNVVGVLTGSDPALRDEIVVVGGHMDHIGVNGDGVVYNGADDNGSGASVVMELARSFAAGPRPARTMIFVTFAGEEQGLLGSKALVADPPFDLSRAVFMANFDMEGNGNGKVGMGGGEFYPAVWRAFRASVPGARAESLTVARAWGGDSSDHASLRNAGVPAMTVWSEGDHPFYHDVDDEAAWVKAEVLGSVGRFAEGWLRTLAGWPRPLASPHRNGRTLLANADQVDFEGGTGALPRWVRGRVRWFPASQYAAPAYLDAVDRLAGADTVAVAASPGHVHGAARVDRNAVVVGLAAGPGQGLPPSRELLLDGLRVGVVRWRGAPPGEAGGKDLAALTSGGAVLLVDRDPRWKNAIPAGAKALIRFRPGRGETVAEPGAYPRKNVLFVASLDGPMDPDSLAAVVDGLGWDRVHLDLAPWLAHGDPGAVEAFVETLQAAMHAEPAHMRAILSENLGRF